MQIVKEVSDARLSEGRKEYQQLKFNNLVISPDAGPLSSFRDQQFHLGESVAEMPAPQIRTSKQNASKFEISKYKTLNLDQKQL